MFCTYLPIDVYVCTYLHSKAYTTYAYVYFTFNSQWENIKKSFRKASPVQKVRLPPYLFKSPAICDAADTLNLRKQICFC